jgi:hypothetical protein
MTRRHDVRDGARQDGDMDEVKRTYRQVETGGKKAARGVDGTDLKDRVGNAGDAARRNLGNLGDDVRRAGATPQGNRIGDRP